MLLNASFFYYFVIFVIIIPYYIIKSKNYALLEVYLPNLDLIANIVAFNNKVFPGEIFKNLYDSDTETSSSFLTKNAINYMALLGLTFIVSRETKISNNIAFGWSIGFVMLLVTYLLPSYYFNEIMEYVHKKTKHIVPQDDKIEYIPSLLVGILLVIGAILIEKLLIQTFRMNLKHIAQFIMKIPSKI